MALLAEYGRVVVVRTRVESLNVNPRKLLSSPVASNDLLCLGGDVHGTHSGLGARAAVFRVVSTAIVRRCGVGQLGVGEKGPCLRPVADRESSTIGSCSG
jgi:hypothetical protein